MILLVTRNKKMQGVKLMLERAATTDTAVLIVGEKGVGKSSCAKWIHVNSKRSASLFAKLPEEYISKRAQLGDYLKNIGEGTLFIDEVSALSIEQQRELLEALSSKKYAFRLIATSTKSPESLVKHGKFVEELYYLLGVTQIKLPTLRERKDDIPLLIESIVQRHNQETNSARSIDKELADMLASRHWHGNAHELVTLLNYLFQYSEAEIISSKDIPIWCVSQHYTASSADSLNSELHRMAGELLQSAKQRGIFNVYEEYEKLVLPPLVRAVLDYTDSNKSQSSELLGINRNTLKKMIREYDL
ncbi:MAG: sigma 54-interacting transcriptional regulator [Deferribacteraceae bacterium]|jgi:DNA-binding NtrC family response regulator|nr:sigma 54-interacting transcriptional regulator [Deferribacteraceae bacterium]